MSDPTENLSPFNGTDLNPLDLDRRLSRAVERGRTIQLSAKELDMLVLSGAIATFRQAVTEQQRAAALARSTTPPATRERDRAGPIELPQQSADEREPTDAEIAFDQVLKLVKRPRPVRAKSAKSVE